MSDEPASPAGEPLTDQKLSPFESRWLGKYKLLKELGRGGMGTVYLAVDTKLDRRVAIKVLPHSVANETRVVQRFEREAQAAARLRHPNIIPIYGAGELEGTYFYSMEHVPGVTLGEIIRELRELKLSQKGSLSVVRIEEDGYPALRLVHDSPSGSFDARPADRAAPGQTLVTFTQRNYVHEALRMFVLIAEALQFAHERGVIHRDIKPSNLLMAPNGRLLLADFGLAKIGDARSITRTGDLLGSPSYMSPEQTMSRRSPVDHRTDVWSLGVTLYEFLTLHHPFEAKSLEVSLRNILSVDPPPPGRFNPRLPKDVETVLQKCLEKNPDRRYATAGELASDLTCVLNYESIQARSAGPITRSLRFVRRNSTRLLVSALCVLLGLVGLFAYQLYSDRERQDLEQGFAYFRGAIQNQASESIDERTVQEIQDSLRILRDETPNLAAAIDMLSFSTLRDAEQYLPSDTRAGNLEGVVRSLRKIRLIHLHNPNQVQRQRIAKIDRATADLRLRLVWAIFDHLAGYSPDTVAPPSTRLIEWLAHFAGSDTGGDADGLAPETNILVRKNAIDAMRRLAGVPDLADQSIPLLRAALFDAREEVEVLCETIKALDTLGEASVDPRILEEVDQLVLDDTFFRLPSLCRYRAAQILSRAPEAIRFERSLKRLLEDPVPPIRMVAEETLAGL